MGIFSFLFPSAEDRVARARKLMDAGRWAEARLEVLDLDHADAASVQRDCETELARINLTEAISWAEAGDDDRVRHHMELAGNFRHGGLDEEFRATRATLRDARQARREAEQRRIEAEANRVIHADTTGSPSWLDTSMPNIYDGDDEEAAARLALVVEGYAAPLRATVGELGGGFARALLDFQDGRPDLAIQGLLELPDDAPLVRFERARAAYALKDPRAAARELREFANLAKGHHVMANQHTGVFLAMCVAETGDLQEALQILRSVRKRDPGQGVVLFAQLLEAAGELDEAESVLAKVIRKHPSDPGLYKLLARVRVAGGHRTAAMAALESSLSIGHCTPGKCGFRPPDIDAMRSLALLYLEDGIETERALELSGQVSAAGGEPSWEDAYLAALTARSKGQPEAAQIASSLWDNTPSTDPRHARLTRFLTVDP